MTFGMSDKSRPRADRIAEASSSSLHLSKASRIITTGAEGFGDQTLHLVMQGSVGNS